MFNPDKRRMSYKLLNKDLIAELEKENPDAQIHICGDNHVVIHVKDDGSGICLDCEDLWEYYKETCEDFDETEDIPAIESNQKVGKISLDRANTLLKLLIKNTIVKSTSGISSLVDEFRELGFTFDELSMIIDSIEDEALENAFHKVLAEEKEKLPKILAISNGRKKSPIFFRDKN